MMIIGKGRGFSSPANPAGGENMPNRIIKESICTSDSIDQLSWFEEVFFYRLIVNCDDYGRFDARLPILKSRLFPLKSVTEKQIEDALNKLSTVGIVLVYEYENRPFLQLVSWERHQTIRNKKSKYPSPADGVPLKEIEINCNQLSANVPVIQSNPNSIQSESESDSLPGATEVPPGPEPVVQIILNDKSLYGITQKQIDHWRELYPAVDVLQELRKMQGWTEANPSKRKTRRGVLRFITNWLAKEQDKGGAVGGFNRQYNGQNSSAPSSFQASKGFRK